MNYEILISTRQNQFYYYFEGRFIVNMGRKEMRKQLEKEQRRTKKNGKNWMYATLTAVGGVIGVNATSANVQAAETSPQANAEWKLILEKYWQITIQPLFRPPLQAIQWRHLQVPPLAALLLSQLVLHLQN